MQTKNWQPNAAQRRWHDLLRQLPCMATLEHPMQCQLHHVAGAAAHQNGIWIGQWYVLPLWHGIHDSRAEHRYHVGKNPVGFERRFGTELDLFLDMTRWLYTRGREVPPLNVIEAIKRWRR